MTSFEDDYLDVLQNLEFTIVQIYHRHSTLVDYEVEKALNALLQVYKRPANRKPPRLRLNPLAEEVFVALKDICDWRLGLDSQISAEKPALSADIEPLSVDELIACLKRIRKSVQTWKKQGGRQGYLEFIDQYVG